MIIRQMRSTRTPHSMLMYLIVVAAVAASLFLMIDFGVRAAALFQAQQKLRQLEDEINRQLHIQERLRARLQYVQSDAYVEEVAHTRLKWTRPGETLVVVMNPPESGATIHEGTALSIAISSPEIESVPASAPPWMHWWWLFFRSPPPEIF
ncbi:MAG: septum formation initiator family protein [Anaerolineae bacterium]|nr:septum formation initiator family protein [Anaerolineae bacterium]MDW8070126.1 septum formation initiator family protein [Anaerolineae bacterium]